MKLIFYPRFQNFFYRKWNFVYIYLGYLFGDIKSHMDKKSSINNVKLPKNHDGILVGKLCMYWDEEDALRPHMTFTLCSPNLCNNIFNHLPIVLIKSSVMIKFKTNAGISSINLAYLCLLQSIITQASSLGNYIAQNNLAHHWKN